MKGNTLKFHYGIYCCSVTQSCLTLCDPMDCSMLSFPVLLLSPGACLNSCPLNRWCHPIILSSVIPFTCLKSFPKSIFLVSLLFASCGPSIGAPASVLLMNIQDWFPVGLTGLISLQSTGLSRVFSNTRV